MTSAKKVRVHRRNCPKSTGTGTLWGKTSIRFDTAIPELLSKGALATRGAGARTRPRTVAQDESANCGRESERDPGSSGRTASTAFEGNAKLGHPMGRGDDRRTASRGRNP